MTVSHPFVVDTISHAVDAAGSLAYLAPNRVNLELASERYPAIVFHATREHAVKLS